VFEAVVTVGGQRRRVTPLTVLGVTSGQRLAEVVGRWVASVDDLAEPRSEVWGEDTPTSGIVSRLVADAGAADILGQPVDRPVSFRGILPSPLARVAPEDFGAFAADQVLLEEIVRDEDDPWDQPEPHAARFVVGELTVNGSSDISLRIDEKALGALVFAADSVIIPFAAAAESVHVRYRPDPGFQARESDEAHGRVQRLVGSPGAPMLIWRCYRGANTGVWDGISDGLSAGWHKVKLAGVDAGVLVGKIVFAAHKRMPGPRGDPTARHRRKSIEKSEEAFVASCPDVSRAPKPMSDIVVAVHGTMSCAVDLAIALTARPTKPRVVRYEHDTWLPIQTNARELADWLSFLGVERAVLVSHSRGGLVSRHAAEILEAEHPEMWIRCVALGTPFQGTPYAGAARTALLGARAFLGAVRLASGAIAVDIPTRMAGLMMRGEVPRGIAAMDVDSDYFSGFAHRPLKATTTVAGDIDPSGPKLANGVGFLRGMARDVFKGAANDLLVTTDSATGGCVDTSSVECDHFSYFQNDQALAAIDRALADASDERQEVVRRATDFSKGLEKDMPVPKQLEIHRQKIPRTPPDRAGE
jgi:pimeloyl-ACP methyl ester carboxylesterase